MVAYAITLMVLLSRNAFPDTEEGGGEFFACPVWCLMLCGTVFVLCWLPVK